MNAKCTDSSRLVDEVAKTAHQMIDRIHDRAVELEQNLGVQSQESGERLVAGVERRAGRLESYIAENPAMAAAIAFGLGVCATGLFKSRTVGPIGSVEHVSDTSDEAQEDAASKAA